LRVALRIDGFPDTPAIQYPPQSSFQANAPVVPSHVAIALNRIKNRGLVAKKADIVAHSMGGCLAKLYGSSDYIRRIVTIGTPHYGSQLADVLLARPWLEPVLNAAGRSMNAGAVHDLQTSGCSIAGDRLGVPVLAINGVIAPEDALPMEGSVYLTILNILSSSKFSLLRRVHANRLLQKEL
jgi:pimeloyl-ACP methyl ester carboxylesterase